MGTGAAISGLAHAALIAVMILGLPWFPRRERPPIPVTDVSFISEADFDRAQAAAQGARDEAAPPEQPRAAPPEPAPDREPEPTPEPESATPPAADAETPPAPMAPEPAVTTLRPEFNPENPLSVPEMAPIEPARPTTDLAAVQPRARSGVTIAPAPQPPAPDEPSEDPAAVPAPVPERSAEVEPEPQPEPESEPEQALAPQTSFRPMARRGDMEVARAEPTPEPEPEAPAEEPADEPTPQESEAQQSAEQAPSSRPSDLVAQLQAERQAALDAGATPPTAPTPPSDGRATATSLPSGPPITNAERNGLVLAVQACWNLPAGLREAGELKVTLAAALNPDGSIVGGSVRLIEPDPVPDARFQRAYDAGRRALLRCAPYDNLPREKYAQWRDIEVVFNPEGMVSW